MYMSSGLYKENINDYAKQEESIWGCNSSQIYIGNWVNSGKQRGGTSQGRAQQLLCQVPVSSENRLFLIKYCSTDTKLKWSHVICCWKEWNDQTWNKTFHNLKLQTFTLKVTINYWFSLLIISNEKTFVLLSYQ